MTENILDFRSDTFTKPSPGMRKAMAEAEVGDDVFGEDPTVRALEQKTAELFGKQAAVFVPSGTMANLIGLAVHCARGDEVIMERRTHSFAHEVGGGAALLGVLFNTVDSSSGYILPEHIDMAVRKKDVHQPISKLVVVENTANLVGGKIVPFDTITALRKKTDEYQMRFHMDGARIWHASTATGVPLHRWASKTHSLSCCLSKGLGCPVGSLVISDSQTVDLARWYRKMLGGGMRQAGVIAACGLYALEHNLPRLHEDHEMAAELAHEFTKVLPEGFQVQAPDTNMVVVNTPDESTCQQTIANWEKMGILCFAVSKTSIRMVTHMDLPPDAAKQAARRIAKAGNGS